VRGFSFCDTPKKFLLIDLTNIFLLAMIDLSSQGDLKKRGFKMTYYKMTTRTYAGTDTKWFSDKKTALVWGSMAVELGYYPTFEKVDENFNTVKFVNFFTLAVKHFFKGGNF
jgi:hypothetical protein